MRQAVIGLVVGLVGAFIAIVWAAAQPDSGRWDLLLAAMLAGSFAGLVAQGLRAWAGLMVGTLALWPLLPVLHLEGTVTGGDLVVAAWVALDVAVASLGFGAARWGERRRRA